MAGKRQKPTERRAFSRPSRPAAELEVVPDAVPRIIPPVPRGLHPVARRAWRAYWESPLSQVIDLAADEESIRRLFYCISERELLEAEVREHPTVEGSQGQPVKNPVFDVLKERIREIEKLREQFGLSPLARMRLGIAYSEADEALDRMQRRREQIQEPVMVEVEGHERDRRTS